MKILLKSKRIKIGILAFICCAIIAIAFAQNKNDYVTKAAEKSEASSTCETKIDFDSKYGVNVSEPDYKNGILKVKIDINESAKGEFTVIYTTDRSNYVTDVIKADKEYSIAVSNSNVDFAMIVSLNNKDGKCGGITDENLLKGYVNKIHEGLTAQVIADDLKNNIGVMGFYVNVGDYNDTDGEELVDNPHINELCKYYKNGNSTKFNDNTSKSECDNALCELVKKYNPTNGTSSNKYSGIDYCNQTHVKEIYTKSTVKQMIKTALYEWQLEKETPGKMKEEIDYERLANYISDGTLTYGNIQELTAKNPKITEQCKTNTLELADPKADMDKDEYVYQTPAIYKHEEEEEVNAVCKRTCAEVIKVEYGPPVATLAGLCFEYQVKVTSVVDCKSKFNGTKPQKGIVCKIKPKCNDTSLHWDQAGPEDEFDECIRKCDNGKYSQKCIDACYKEVYEDEKNELALAYNNKYSNVEKLGTSYITNAGLYCSTENANALSKELVENYENYDCKYKLTSNNSIYWSCSYNSNSNSVPYWMRLGKYYFTSGFNTLTLSSITTYDNTVCHESRGAYYYNYIIDNYGFKRACYGRSGSRTCSSTCGESCYWWASCGGAYVSNANLYPANKNSNYFIDQEDAEKVYNEKLAVYNSQKQECLAAASCNTTTSTYTISINNKIESGKDNKHEWSATIENKSKNGDDIFISTDFCYSPTSTSTTAYEAEWTFPGTWINNKLGTIEYDSTKTNPRTWKFNKNRFCSLLNSKPVNSEWWDWFYDDNTREKYINRVNLKYKNGKIEDIKDWNIEAIASKFGYFDWNINIKCFYAIPECYDSTCTEETPITAKKSRSVNLEELFPTNTRDTDGDGVSDKIGYNWTNKVKDTSKPYYEINPEGLIKDIQKIGDNIYESEYKDKYLDYEFYIDKGGFKKLQEFYKNNKKGKYTQFGNRVWYWIDKDSQVDGHSYELVSTDTDYENVNKLNPIPQTFYKSELTEASWWGTNSGKIKINRIPGCNRRKKDGSTNCHAYPKMEVVGGE